MNLVNMDSIWILRRFNISCQTYGNKYFISPIISLLIYKLLRAKNKALNLIQIIVFLSIFFTTIYPGFPKIG